MVDGRHCASLRPLAPPLTLHGVAGGGEGGDPPLAPGVTAGLLRVRRDAGHGGGGQAGGLTWKGEEERSKQSGS